MSEDNDMKEVYMKQKEKKYISIAIIIVLLPYVMTVFMKGEGIIAVQSTELNTQVLVQVQNMTVSVTWEEYLIGLLAKEIPLEYSMEAMKAQAIIIRTRLAIAQGEEEDYVFQEDYYSAGEIQMKWGDNDSVEIYNQLSEVIQETEGMALYYNGDLAMTPYHALNNGMTRNGSEVLASQEYPYLISVSCPLDSVAEEEISMVAFTYEELYELLDTMIDMEETSNGWEELCGNIEVSNLDEAGYVLSLDIMGNSVSGELFRTELALKSSAFTIEERDSDVLITTLGNGHGLGLSQNTAHYMGLEGKTYEEILAYFYIDTEILCN